MKKIKKQRKGAWNSNCEPCVFFAPKRRNMNDNIQTIATGKIPPCLQQTIDNTRYLAKVHFGNIQSVGDKLKRVILHNLQHGEQGKSRKKDEHSLTSSDRQYTLIWKIIYYAHPSKKIFKTFSESIDKHLFSPV